MSYSFRPAVRENVPLLLGFAGGTGSGKTMSALRVARGLAGGHPFAAVDTENGRMSHYADLFRELRVTDITAPFRPDKYTEAIQAGQAYLEAEDVPVANRVVLVDSASHEWYGDGGCLDWHDELMGGDQKKNLSAWIDPKKSHKSMVTRLLQLEAHVILCFRAEPKVEAVRVNGRTEIRPKESLVGLDGWIPITEKNLPFEMTASFLLMADAPGVPRPIKLQEQHRALVPLDAPLDEKVGEALGAWAAGGAAKAAAPAADKSAEIAEALHSLYEAADAKGLERATVEGSVEKNRASKGDAAFLTWVRKQTARIAEMATSEPSDDIPVAPATDEADGEPEFSYADRAAQAQAARAGA